MFFAENLKFLREKKQISQSAMARDLDISRTTLIGYEKGVQPPFHKLLKMADYLGFSLDALIRCQLKVLSDFQLSEIARGEEIDLTGRQLRLLTITTDSEGRENIEMVNEKAQAGYTGGYGDPEFLAALPCFQLPFLDPNKTYRCFQITGDSMLPIPDGAWVTCSFVRDWTSLKKGARYIVVTREQGIVFKRLYPDYDEKNLTLVSTNELYEPYTLPFTEILELWEYATHNTVVGG